MKSRCWRRSGLVVALLTLVGFAGAAPCTQRDQKAATLDELMPSKYAAPTSDHEAETLEAVLVEHPNNAALHVTLLVYYSGHGAPPQTLGARTRHVLWLISHRPASAIAGDTAFGLPDADQNLSDRVEAAWDEQIEKHSGSVTVLRNAANFMLRHSTPEAYAAWEQVAELGADDLDAMMLVAMSYEVEASGAVGAEQVKVARRALKYFMACTSPAMSKSEKAMVYRGVIKTAIMSGDLSTAKHFADAWLIMPDDLLICGDDAQYWAVTALGLAAIRAGNKARAAEFLEKSALKATALSIDLELASDLLSAGRGSDVVRFLERLGERLPFMRKHAEEWKIQILSGEHPRLSL